MPRIAVDHVVTAVDHVIIAVDHIVMAVDHIVMAGLDPAIHAVPQRMHRQHCTHVTAWMTGSTPVMTVFRGLWSTMIDLQRQKPVRTTMDPCQP